MKNPQLVRISDKTKYGNYGIRTGWFDREHLVAFIHSFEGENYYETEDGYVVTGSMIIWDIPLGNE